MENMGESSVLAKETADNNLKIILPEKWESRILDKKVEEHCDFFHIILKISTIEDFHKWLRDYENLTGTSYVIQNTDVNPEQEDIKNIPQQNSEEKPSFRLVNVDALKEISQIQPIPSQLGTRQTFKLSNSLNDTSSKNEMILCPSTALVSPSTGLEVKPRTNEPSSVVPMNTKLPAGSKAIIDPKFSLSSAPVQLNTLVPHLKEEPMDCIRTSPVMRQKETGVLNLDRISEEELARLIEEDSPLLTAEMIFSRKRVYQKRYIGDLKMDDFGTPAGRRFYLAAKKRAKIYKTKIKTSMMKRNRLRNRLVKFNRMLKILESTCDVSEAKRILEGKEKDDDYSSCSSESSLSKEESESDTEPIIMNQWTRIDPVHFASYEEQETRINHFEFSNRVQVKFLSDRDTEMISTLKIEMNKLSHADISKSKRIDELYNVIFRKNKIIDDLQRQIEELKQTGNES